MENEISRKIGPWSTESPEHSTAGKAEYSGLLFMTQLAGEEQTHGFGFLSGASYASFLVTHNAVLQTRLSLLSHHNAFHFSHHNF